MGVKSGFTQECFLIDGEQIAADNQRDLEPTLQVAQQLFQCINLCIRIVVLILISFERLVKFDDFGRRYLTLGVGAELSPVRCQLPPVTNLDTDADPIEVRVLQLVFTEMLGTEAEVVCPLAWFETLDHRSVTAYRTECRHTVRSLRPPIEYGFTG
jgi:hypothetical protein